jgi:hypothetical protein
MIDREVGWYVKGTGVSRFKLCVEKQKKLSAHGPQRNCGCEEGPTHQIRSIR